MNYNKYLDISGIGKALKNASKSVEKSIDGLIGIPDSDQNNSNTDTVPLSSSPSSYFGLSFTSPTTASNTTTTTNNQQSPNKPIDKQSPNVLSPIVKPQQQKQEVQQQQQLSPQKKIEENKTPPSINVSPIIPRKQQVVDEENDDSDSDENSKPLFMVKNDDELDSNEDLNKSEVSSKFLMDDQDISNASFGDNDVLDIPDILDSTDEQNSQKDHQPQEIQLSQQQESKLESQSEQQREQQVQSIEQPEKVLEKQEQQEEQEQKHQQQKLQEKEVEKSIDNSTQSEQIEYKQKLLETESKLSALIIVNQEKDRIISEREKQCQNLSNHGAKLQKTVDQLLVDIERLNSNQKKEDIENLKEEFSRRLAQMEKKLKDAQKERDSHKSGVVMSEQLATQLKDKDDQISQLMSEGTNLSHKILQHENTIKKLRSTNKENEETINMMNERIRSTEDLLVNKQDRLKELEETDRKYHDTLLTMKEVTQMTTKKYEEKDMVAERAAKQATELQTALEKAWRDISDLTKQQTIDRERFNRDLEEVRNRVKDEMIAAFQNERKEMAKREETLEMVIQEQKSSIQRMTEKAMWKEEELNKEIQHLNQRCREAEFRNDQLGASIPETTRPLIKQIESLQSANEAKQNTWDALEKSLQQQLREARNSADQAIQNEKESIEELEEVTKLNVQFEIDLKKERNNNNQLQTDINNQKTRVKELESKVKEQIGQIEQHKDNNLQLQKQLSNYEDKLEKSYKDYREAEELRQKERELEKERREEEKRSPLNQSYDTPSKLYGLRKNSSQLDFMQLQQQQQQNQSGGNSSLPMEFYQSNIHQKDGEIAILQSKLQSSETLKKKLEDELIKLTSSNEQLLTESKELKGLRSEIQEIQKRYSTALVMLGEKEEAVNEMKMDIIDMKELYKTQINELLGQIESLKKQLNK